MKSITLICVLLLTAFVGDAAWAGETNAVLLQIVAKLQPAWAGLDPAPTCEYSATDAEGGALLIRYQTSTFAVPPQSVTANSGANTNLVEAIGPTTNGFLLRINLERLGEGNQITTPSTRQELFWQTFFNCTPVGGTTNQIYWALSYGSQTDKDLVGRLEQNLVQQGFVQVRRNATPRLTGDPLAPMNLQIIK